jgi:hypothetical protein
MLDWGKIRTLADRITNAIADSGSLLRHRYTDLIHAQPSGYQTRFIAWAM